MPHPDPDDRGPTRSKPSLVFIAAAALAIVAAFVSADENADKALTTGDPDRGAWFQSLLRPDFPVEKQASCCDVSDCERTLAKQLDDESWVAIVNQKWVAIPPEKIVTAQTTIDGEAYVCHSEDIIYCFVRPVPGF